MIIVFDVDLDVHGNVIATHFLDSANVAWQGTFTSINNNPAAQTTAGYNIVHKVTGRPALETRWQLIKALAASAPAGDFLHGVAIV